MYTQYDLIIAGVAMPFVILFTIGLWFLLRKKGKQEQLIPFIIIAVLFVALEIMKQVSGLTRESGYNQFFIPLHICSVFLYSLPFAVFFKQGGRVSNTAWTITLFVGLMVTLTMLIAPSQVIGQQSQSIITGMRQDTLLIDLHSVIYHYLVILMFALMVIFRPYRPVLKDYFMGTIIFALFLGFSLMMATILGVNFADFRQTDLVGLIDFGTNAIWVQLLRIIGYIAVSWIAIAILYFPQGINYLIKTENK